jgi:hypothetical protein
MKVYIIIDEFINVYDEHSRDYCDCFANAEEALKYIADYQKDGHKLVVIEKEFDDPYVPQIAPIYPYCPYTPQTPKSPYEPPYTISCSVEQRKEVDND